MIYRVRLRLSLAAVATLVFTCFAYSTASTIAAKSVDQYDAEDRRKYFPDLRSILAGDVLGFALAHEGFVLLFVAIIVVGTLQICYAVRFSILGVYSVVPFSCCCCICNCAIGRHNYIRLIWFCTSTTTSFWFQNASSIIFLNVLVRLLNAFFCYTCVRVRVSLIQVCNFMSSSE